MAKQKAYNENQKRLLEAARLAGWLALIPNLKDNHSSPDKVLPFPWESAPKARFEPIDLEVFRRFHEESERILLADLNN